MGGEGSEAGIKVLVVMEMERIHVLPSPVQPIT